MDEESKPLTTFIVGPLGFYECERVPFGLINAPITFQRLMETCLGDLNLYLCIIYLDDIVIFSRDLASHLEHLEAVFQKIEEAELKLKPSKCELFQWQIAYLGHIVSAQRIATDEGKIVVINKWPVLKNVMDIQGFLGFMGYYQQFIPKFSQVAQPLHELTLGENAEKKKAAIQWNDRVWNCQVGKTNIDADALLRVSWPGCMPDNSGLTSRSQLQWYEPCKKLPLKAPQAP